MLNVKQISKSFGSQIILSDVSFSLAEGQKVALVGINGVGKSTLLKIIAGLTEPDSGRVDFSHEANIGYLAQETTALEGEIVKNYLKRISGVQELENKIDSLQPYLDENEKLKEYEEAQQNFLHLGGYQFDHLAKTILKGFGLGENDFGRELESFSGGQKRKIAIAGILLKGADLLLLDEPTNNMDLPSIIWLEKFIKGAKAASLIISHDRTFLDKIVSKVLELDWDTHELQARRGSYSDYLVFKEKKFQREKELYLIQEEEKKRIKGTIRDQKIWAQKGAKQEMPDKDKYIRGARRDRSAKLAGRAKNLEKQMERMDLEAPKERAPLRIPLEPAKSDAKHSIRLKKVSAGYNGFQIGPVDFEIPYGTRIGILGINGSGKTTLLKVITGKLEILSGEVNAGISLKVGNLTQEHDDLPPEISVFEFLSKEGEADQRQIYHLLNRFQFAAEEVKKKIKDLSPGQKVRLLLALFSIRSVNTLVLDEPTNHLDLEALGALEEMIGDYEGTIILVSHDRSFLEKAKLTDLFLLEGGSLKRIYGLEDYISTLSGRAERLLKSL
ncbi:ATP-binding cassette domain-containing protein [Patescibacteria group bacterium]|nr:ATP-binding cassette domain-containing protein [Patescibacteria group bacterium]